MSIVRVVLADDHTVVRQALQSILSLDPELDLVGEAGSGDEAFRLCGELHPDVVLMDLLMPGGGVSAIRMVHDTYPEIHTVALTSALDDASVLGAVKAGATSYMLKTTDAAALVDAIKAAADGQSRISPEAAALMMRGIRAPESPESLTERETDVLRLVATGKSNKDIARTLYLSEQTVKTHISHILAKLQLDSRVQAAIYATQLGMTPAGQSTVS